MGQLIFGTSYMGARLRLIDSQRYHELQDPAISSALSGTCVFTGGKVCVMSGGYNYDGWQITGKGG